MMRPFPMMGQMPQFYYDSRYDEPYPPMGEPYNMYGPANFPQSMPYYQEGMFPPQEMQQMQPQMYPHPMQGNMQPYGQGMFNGGHIPMPQPQMGYQQPAAAPPMAGAKPSPFANPLHSPKVQQQLATQYPNPYPKQAFMQKQQPSGFQSIMNQFKTQDGSMDVTKMMNTAGQMMGTVNQVGSMFKGLGGFFKAT
ncbi:YppG family protein [Bacillus massiliigorillae]|uniref:YppG family protein n=1 Tax=Bacillus massiliigorillae TaxID=1243664 RepID=UPI00039F7782|nr:YppG family protein [Bacillus massiliigorillae]